MTNLKLTVIDSADFWAVEEFCIFAKEKGYEVTLVDNGNIVFDKIKSSSKETCANGEKE